MKKNGFISTSLIYTFFILFLLLMIFLLNSYTSNRFLLERYKYDIKNTFAEESGADINIYFMVYNDSTQEYELENDMPTFGYNFETEYSYCKNGSSISYSGGDILVSAQRKDYCYAYFSPINQDINLRIYTKETNESDKVRVKNIPNYNYDYTAGTCTNDAYIEFDETTREFSITSSHKTVCEVEFTKQTRNVELRYYRESSTGTITYNDFKYEHVDNVPDANYIFYDYECGNPDVNTIITNENNQLNVISSGDNICHIYYNGSEETVNIIIMQESDTGVSGYTTGKKYSRTYSVPSTGYKYVGYLCDSSLASVTYSNGTFIGESSVPTTCRVYFNHYSGNIFMNYYLETSTGNYESVSTIPSLGYVYNESKSSCKNNSTIKVDNNIVMVEATEDDECNVYFDMAIKDIEVRVYVLNKETGNYELGNVPKAGYTLYNAGCTNGAVIEYKSGNLKVSAEGPTVCTVYFN